MGWTKGKKRTPRKAGEKIHEPTKTYRPKPEPPPELPDDLNAASDEQLERLGAYLRARKEKKAQAALADEKAVSWKMKAGNNWDSVGDNVPEEGVDKFKIAKEHFPEGMDLQWWTCSVLGQPTKDRISTAVRGGWTQVHDNDFDNWHKRVLASQFPLDDNGYIVKDGMALCARPQMMSVKARFAEKKKADDQVALKEQAFKEGNIPGVSGASHPLAVTSNKLNRSRDYPIIPKE